jgi:hypothetical protein
MTRRKGQAKAVLNVRADLGNLLVPALDDLARMVSNVIDAKEQVCAALEKME